MEDKIRWGIAGPGNIAQKFAHDLGLVPSAELMAVASRNRERALDFAKEFNIPKGYGSYDELFEDPNVDVVYIAVPHRFHKDLSIRAMRAGKHVLCEKPLGVNAAEVAEMIQVAKEQGVFLMEGLWSRFNPALVKVKELVDYGAIGKLSYLNADFSFYAMDRDKDSRLLNPELASGSILDIGIYPVFLSYLLLGKPTDINAQSHFMGNGTEVQTSILLKYDQALSVLYSGFMGPSKMEAKVSGDRGEIIIHERWHQSEGLTLTTENGEEKIDLPKRGHGFVHEIEEVQRCIQKNQGESSLWNHHNSLELAQLLDQIRNCVGIQFPFER